jgi:hypothetical protein
MDALDQLRRAKPLRQLFGDDFVEALIMRRPSSRPISA